MYNQIVSNQQVQDMSPIQNIAFDPRNTQSEKDVILEFEKKVSRYVKGNANNPEKLLSEIFELSVDYQNAVYPERFIKFLELQANAPAEILMILMSVCREYDFHIDVPEKNDIWEFVIPANVIVDLLPALKGGDSYCSFPTTSVGSCC